MSQQNLSVFAKKKLVLLDGIQSQDSKAMIQHFLESTCRVEFFIIDEQVENWVDDTRSIPIHYISINDVATLYSRQRIGTTLHVIGKQAFIQRMMHQAYMAGFSDHEIQFLQTDTNKDQILCVKCYKLLSKLHDEEQTCVYCQSSLQVSKHFSKRHNAYLGYIKIG